jgi:tetratricopeptide (TPR) repeat protein
MKNTYKNILESLLVSSLAISSVVLADQAADSAEKATIKSMAPVKVDQEQTQTNHKAIKKKQDKQNSLLEEVNKGISEGFHKVQQATKLINDGKEKEAIKALQEATGKFDIALAANPDIKLIPIAAEVRVNELLTTSALVKTQVDLAKDLLKDSRVQAARTVLLPLRDDMETRTAYLPMATYPDAIKLATKMLIEKNKDAALQTLAVALSTVVEKSSIIPLSLIRAEALITSASELDKDQGKDKALKLLDAAKEQLDVATALGYTAEDSDLYSALKDQISALKKEITGGNVVEKLYDKLKTSFKTLVKKKSDQKIKDKAVKATTTKK